MTWNDTITLDAADRDDFSKAALAPETARHLGRADKLGRVAQLMEILARFTAS